MHAVKPKIRTQLCLCNRSKFFGKGFGENLFRKKGFPEKLYLLAAEQADEPGDQPLIWEIPLIAQIAQSWVS